MYWNHIFRELGGVDALSGFGNVVVSETEIKSCLGRELVIVVGDAVGWNEEPLAAVG
jgi:hypothetical protein